MRYILTYKNVSRDHPPALLDGPESQLP
jgi:hypothetical protein